VSTLKINTLQIGQSGTATNNFCWSQPSTPDGTVRLGNGNAGSATDILIATSAGNLGLGVTPSAWGSAWKSIQIGTVASIYQDNSANVLLGRNTYHNGTSNLYLTNGYAQRIYMNASGEIIFNNAPSGTAGNAISFTQAMTLDASGNLLVGLTSSSRAKLCVNANSAAISSAASFFANFSSSQSYPAIYCDKYDNTNTTSQVFIQFTINNQGTASGQINANGASQVAFGSWSDARLKENVIPLSSQLTNILALYPCEFDYKDGSGHQIGFIAQDMQAVYPDTVGEGEDGMLTITGWSKTEARLVKAIQELSAELNELKAKVNA
jgi:hypothetical protein